MIKSILLPADKQSIEIGDLTLPNHADLINEGDFKYWWGQNKKK